MKTYKNVLHVYVNDNTKEQITSLCDSLGMSMSSFAIMAINKEIQNLSSMHKTPIIKPLVK